jgi:hypothetical protein
MNIISICVVGIVFWSVVSMLSGAAEPWDAASFWTLIYPAALALSVVLGAIFQRVSLLAGAIVMFAQLPVVTALVGVSPLLAAGVIYVAVLSVPAMMLSWIAGRLRRFYSGE